MKIRITTPAGALTAALGDASPRTREALLRALPVEGKANLWGDEIYFRIPVSAPSEPGARDLMQAGEVAFWPPGSAFCVFWGPTPASRGGEIRAASPVNVLGRIEGDLEPLKRIRQGDAVKIDPGE
jgi:hypothetical protein